MTRPAPFAPSSIPVLHPSRLRRAARSTAWWFIAATFVAASAARAQRSPPSSIAFFPPWPPPLGAPVSNATTTYRINGAEIVTPPELADHVGEYFYPALGTRLFGGPLSAKLAPRLAGYRTARDALVNELLNQIESLKTADPAARERALADFAPRQATRLAALEQDAEQLRAELIRGGLLDGSADWNSTREWRLGDIQPPLPHLIPAAEYQVIRAAAFYQNGLPVEQRALLREIALELRARARPPAPDARGLRSPATAMFFSPAPARIWLPANLPPELVVLLGTFNRDRIALKTELREAIFALDRVASDAKRTRALVELGERQWPRLAALEKLAEEIRRALAALPEPPLPAAPPRLPRELLERIDAYKRDRTALAAELAARMREFRTPPPRSVPFDPDMDAITRRERMETAIAESMAARGATIQEVRDEFRRANAARYDELEQRVPALRNDIEAFARTQTDPATGQPYDAASLMRRFNTATMEFETLGREQAIYHHYRTAVLQPGLSDAQRRLLFAAAVAGLAQPLPAGERFPYRVPAPGLN